MALKDEIQWCTVLFMKVSMTSHQYCLPDIICFKVKLMNEFRIYVTEENDGVKRWDSMVLCHHWSESRLLELESAKLRKKS